MADTTSPITVRFAFVVTLASAIMAAAFMRVIYPVCRLVYHAAQDYNSNDGPHNPAESSGEWGNLFFAGMALCLQVALCFGIALAVMVVLEVLFPKLEKIFNHAILK
jgi:hypothetical protein